MLNITSSRTEYYDGDQCIATEYHFTNADFYDATTFLFGELLSYYIGGVKPVHIEKFSNHWYANFQTVDLCPGSCDCYIDFLYTPNCASFIKGETIFSDKLRLIRRTTKCFDVDNLCLIKEEDYEKIVNRVKELGIKYQLHAIKH